MERTVTAVREEGLRCRVRAGAFDLVVDEPESVGGTDRGPQPTELFLASVASCFTLALSWSARKRDLDPSSIEVETTGIYDGPRFSTVRIVAKVGGLEAEEVATLVTAAERVCYVTNTLRRAPEIEIDWE
ncbi:OsmC family protein [Pseudonocardia endophytica]|uniref:Putative OsmC-like protein n=1 Tax=Pseudonocardia endophytica TaxID=401976 RepID=A0A4V2PIF5_PSEEN|nr:OsmC family protein [Pseudonocardia endophytica]TCK24446.1 putative OsmC-like protein [Pseudonocardia endophytica]